MMKDKPYILIVEDDVPIVRRHIVGGVNSTLL